MTEETTKRLCNLLEQAETSAEAVTDAMKAGLQLEDMPQTMRDSLTEAAFSSIDMREQFYTLRQRAWNTEPGEALDLQALCSDLAALTEENQHSEAVVKLAGYAERITDGTQEAASCARLHRWARWIKAEHERAGHLPPELGAFRLAVLKGCLSCIERTHGAEEAEAIRRAF